jgi:hypothetical protein
MNDTYLELFHALQTASWRGYRTRHDNGRYYATDGNDTFYLNRDESGRFFYWILI